MCAQENVLHIFACLTYINDLWTTFKNRLTINIVNAVNLSVTKNNRELVLSIPLL